MGGILFFWSFLVPLIIRYSVQHLDYSVKFEKIIVDVGDVVHYNADMELNVKVPTSVDVKIRRMSINEAMTITVDDQLEVANHNKWNITGTAIMNPTKIKSILKNGISNIDVTGAIAIKKYLPFYDFLWIERSEKIPEYNVLELLRDVRWSLNGLSVDVTSAGFDIKIDVVVEKALPLSLTIEKAATRLYLGNLYLGKGGVRDLTINKKITHLNAFLTLEDNWKYVQSYMSKESNAVGLLNNASISGPIELYKNDKVVNWLYEATDDLKFNFGLKDILKTFLTAFADIKAFIKTVDVVVQSKEDLFVLVNFPFKVQHFHLSKPVSFNVYYKELKIVSVRANPDVTNNMVTLKLNLNFFNFNKLDTVAYDYLIRKSMTSGDLLKQLFIGNIKFEKEDCDWCSFMLNSFRLSLDFLDNLENSSVFDDALDIIKSLVTIKNVDSIQSNTYSGFDAIAHVKLSDAFHSIKIDLNNVFISVKHVSEFVYLQFDSLVVRPGWNNIPCKVPFLHDSNDFANIIHELLYGTPSILYLNQLLINDVDMTVNIPLDLKWFFKSAINLHDYVSFNLTSIELSMDHYNQFTADISIELNNQIPLHVKTNDLAIYLSIDENVMFDVKLSDLNMPLGYSNLNFKSLVGFGNASIKDASAYVMGLMYNKEPDYTLSLNKLMLQGPKPVDLFNKIKLSYHLLDSIHGLATVNTNKLITPIKPMELEILSAKVEGIRNGELAVNVQFKVFNPIPAAIDIPFVTFALGIEDVTILTGSLNVFHMAKKEFIFDGEIKVLFGKSKAVQDVIAKFMDNAFNKRDNLAVWVDQISMGAPNKQYTHILNELKVYFTRFIEISSQQFTDYLHRVAIGVHGVDVDFTDTMHIELDASVSLPFKWHIIMPYIKLHVYLNDVASMAVTLRNVDVNNGKSRYHIDVDFLNPIPSNFNTFSISNLVIGVSKNDHVTALSSIYIGAPLSTFAPLISIPLLRMPSNLDLNKLVLQMGKNGDFKLGLDLFFDLHLPVSIYIPNIRLGLLLNNDKVLELEISDFRLSNGKLHQINVMGSFVGNIDLEIQLFKSITGSVGVKDLVIANSHRSITQLSNIRVDIPLVLISYLLPLINIKPLLQGIKSSISHVNVNYIDHGLLISPIFKLVTPQLDISIPYASADIGINNELFVQSIINNKQLQVLFAEDHHKSDAINHFLTGSELNINLNNIKFGTVNHVTNALSRINVIIGVTMDQLYTLFMKYKHYLPTQFDLPFFKSLSVDQKNKELLGDVVVEHSVLHYITVDKLQFMLNIPSLVNLNTKLQITNNILSIHYSLVFHDSKPSNIQLSNIQVGVNNIFFLNDIKIDLSKFTFPQIPQFDMTKVIALVVAQFTQFKVQSLQITNEIVIGFRYNLSHVKINLNQISTNIFINDILLLHANLHINTNSDNLVHVTFNNQASLELANIINGDNDFTIGLADLIIGDIHTLAKFPLQVRVTTGTLSSIVSSMQPFVKSILKWINTLKLGIANIVISNNDALIHAEFDLTSLPFQFNLPSCELTIGHDKEWMTISANIKNNRINADVALDGNGMDDIAVFYNHYNELPLFIRHLKFSGITILEYLIIPVYYKWIPANNIHIGLGVIDVVPVSVDLRQNNDFDLELKYTFTGGISLDLKDIKVDIVLGETSVLHVQVAKLTNTELTTSVRFTNSVEMKYPNRVGISGLYINGGLFSKLNVGMSTPPSHKVMEWVNKLKKKFKLPSYTFGDTTLDINDAGLDIRSKGSVDVPLQVQLEAVSIKMEINKIGFGTFTVHKLAVINNEFQIELVGDLINSKEMSVIIKDIYMGILNHKLPNDDIQISQLVIGDMHYLQELVITVPILMMFPNNIELQIPKISDLTINNINVDIIAKDQIALNIDIDVRNPFMVSLNVDTASANLFMNDHLFTNALVNGIHIKPGITNINTTIICGFNSDTLNGAAITDLINGLLYKSNPLPITILREIGFGNKQKLYTLINDIDIGISFGGSMPGGIKPYLEIIKVKGEVNRKGLDVSALIKISPSLTGNIFGIDANIMHSEFQTPFVSLSVDNLNLNEGTLDALIRLPSIEAVKDIWETSVAHGNIFNKLKIKDVVIKGPVVNKGLTFLKDVSVKLPDHYVKEDIIAYFTIKNLLKLMVNVFVPIALPFDVDINFHNFYFQAWDYVDKNRTKLDYLVATVDEQFVFKTSDKGAKIGAKFSGSFWKLGNIIARMNRVKGLKDIRVHHPVDGDIEWIRRLNEVGFFFKGEFRLQNPEIQEMKKLNASNTEDSTII